MTANLVTVRIGLVHQGLLDVKLGEKKERRGEESGDEESDEGENECLDQNMTENTGCGLPPPAWWRFEWRTV